MAGVQQFVTGMEFGRQLCRKAMYWGRKSRHSKCFYPLDELMFSARTLLLLRLYVYKFRKLGKQHFLVRDLRTWQATRMTLFIKVIYGEMNSGSWRRLDGLDARAVAKS